MLRLFCLYKYEGNGLSDSLRHRFCVELQLFLSFEGLSFQLRACPENSGRNLLKSHKALLGCLYKYEGNGLSDFQTFGLFSPQMHRLDFKVGIPIAIGTVPLSNGWERDWMFSRTTKESLTKSGRIFSAKKTYLNFSCCSKIERKT